MEAPFCGPPPLLPGNRRSLQALRVLDLCSGPGSIALLLSALLTAANTPHSILGVDISPRALSFARKGLGWNIRTGALGRDAAVGFVEADVLAEDKAVLRGRGREWL